MVKETCHEILRYFSQEYFLLEENFTKQFENFSTNEIIALMRFIHLRTSLSSISSIFSSFSFCFPFLPLLFIFSLYFLSLFYYFLNSPIMGKPRPKPVVPPSPAPAAESKDPETEDSTTEEKGEGNDTEKK